MGVLPSQRFAGTSPGGSPRLLPTISEIPTNDQFIRQFDSHRHPG